MYIRSIRDPSNVVAEEQHEASIEPRNWFAAKCYRKCRDDQIFLYRGCAPQKKRELHSHAALHEAFYASA